MANSPWIKNATEQYNLGLISTWQFLSKCAYASEAYELIQRNWALTTNQADAEPKPVIVDPVHLELAQPDLPPIRTESPPLPNHPNSPDAPIPQSICITCIVVTIDNSENRNNVLPCGHA